MALGTSENHPAYLNAKIRLTNSVACSLLFIAAAYTVFSLVVYPALAWLPATGFPVIILAMFLGAAGAYNIYRFLIVLVPIAISFGYHEALINAGDPPLASTILLQGAFALLPFIIFDLRDRWWLFISAAISFCTIVFFRSAEGWFEYGLDDSIFRSGYMHEITVAIALLLFYSSVYTLSLMNARSEKKSQELLEKGNQQNEELQQQRLEMQKNLQELEESQNEERRRAWASQGFSQFATLMRQSTNVEQMFDELLAGIVKYVKANQAGLYIVEGEEGEKHLRLQACYAYGRKKFKEQVIQPGQGLVGQTYLEKDYVYRTDIPQGYTFITSGLGEATPAALLIIPLMSNEVVEGVLEIAAFKPFEKHEIAFLMKLGEDIASTVGVSRINELTRKLLVEAQEQTEEMRAQEEEMRQNMEELSATQEEMQRKELQISGQLSAINRTLATAEFDARGGILTANRKFLELTGYSLEQIQGQHHKLLVSAKYAASPEYINFWEQLGQGNHRSGEFRSLKKGGSVIWLQATYSPVLNEDGRVVKIILFATDITEQKQQALDYLGQVEAIRKSNAVVEYNMEGQVLDANHIFLFLIGYSLEEVKEQHHSLFVKEEEKDAEEYKELWEMLRAGEFVSGEFLRKKSNGEELWVFATYYPIMDTEGRPYKVVEYAQDISDRKLMEEA